MEEKKPLFISDLLDAESQFRGRQYQATLKAQHGGVYVDLLGSRAIGNASSPSGEEAAATARAEFARSSRARIDSLP